jgi:carbon storage regulator CsrA
MLVLSRKINERIIIDGNIEVEGLGLRGGVVRLGIKGCPVGC